MDSSSVCGDDAIPGRGFCARHTDKKAHDFKRGAPAADTFLPNRLQNHRNGSSSFYRPCLPTDKSVGWGSYSGRVDSKVAPKKHQIQNPNPYLHLQLPGRRGRAGEGCSFTMTTGCSFVLPGKSAGTAIRPRSLRRGSILKLRSAATTISGFRPSFEIISVNFRRPSTRSCR